MTANGIARLGLGCAIALTSNPGYATMLDESRIGEFVANPTELSGRAMMRFEARDPAAPPLDSNGLPLDDGDRHRIDTDLLTLPREYLTLARSTAPGLKAGCLPANESRGEIGFGGLAVDVPPLVFACGLDARGHAESPGLSRPAPSDGRTPAGLGHGSDGSGATEVAGGEVSSGNGLRGNAGMFAAALLALVSPILLPRPAVEEPES